MCFPNVSIYSHVKENPVKILYNDIILAYSEDFEELRQHRSDKPQ